MPNLVCDLMFLYPSAWHQGAKGGSTDLSLATVESAICQKEQYNGK